MLIVVCIVGNPGLLDISGGGVIVKILGPAGLVPRPLTSSTIAWKSSAKRQFVSDVELGPPQSTSQSLEQPLRAAGAEQVLWASLVPSMMTMMSHLFFISVSYCGRFQNGELLFFSIIEPQAPMLVTAYLPWNVQRRQRTLRPLSATIALTVLAAHLPLGLVQKNLQLRRIRVDPAT